LPKGSDLQQIKKQYTRAFFNTMLIESLASKTQEYDSLELMLFQEKAIHRGSGSLAYGYIQKGFDRTYLKWNWTPINVTVNMESLIRHAWQQRELEEESGQMLLL